MGDLIVWIWRIRYLVIIIYERRRGLEVDSIPDPINFSVPFLKPGHSKDDLGSRKLYNHEFYCVRENSKGE